VFGHGVVALPRVKRLRPISNAFSESLRVSRQAAKSPRKGIYQSALRLRDVARVLLR
jgi:hypothetical protein